MSSFVSMARMADLKKVIVVFQYCQHLVGFAKDARFSYGIRQAPADISGNSLSMPQLEV